MYPSKNIHNHGYRFLVLRSVMIKVFLADWACFKVSYLAKYSVVTAVLEVLNLQKFFIGRFDRDFPSFYNMSLNVL